MPRYLVKPTRRHLSRIILCLLVTSCLTRNGYSSFEVYWDIGHGVTDDYQPSGRYQELADFLSVNAFNVVTGSSPLDQVDLTTVSTLVIANGSAAFSPFTNLELNTIDDFVRNGGGLLLMSDVAGSSGIPQIQQVADLFGALVGLQQFTAADVFSTRIDPHPAVAGVGQMYIRFSSTVNPGILTPYAWFNDMPMLAAGTLDQGRAVLIADGDLFTITPTGDRYFDRADNRQLADSVFRWLAGSSPVPEPTSLAVWSCLIGATALFFRRSRNRVR